MQKKLAAIKNLPLHIHLGVEDIQSDAGAATLRTKANDNTLNPAGYYHGGVIYMLCDVCAYSGVLSALDPSEDAVTHDIHVSVLRPVSPGATVIYQSTLVKRGRTLCFIDVTATCDTKVVATARITKSIVKLS